jgi:hypothetical protein
MPRGCSPGGSRSSPSLRSICSRTSYMTPIATTRVHGYDTLACVMGSRDEPAAATPARQDAAARCWSTSQAARSHQSRRPARRPRALCCRLQSGAHRSPPACAPRPRKRHNMVPAVPARAHAALASSSHLATPAPCTGPHARRPGARPRTQPALLPCRRPAPRPPGAAAGGRITHQCVSVILPSSEDDSGVPSSTGTCTSRRECFRRGWVRTVLVVKHLPEGGWPRAAPGRRHSARRRLRTQDGRAARAASPRRSEERGGPASAPCQTASEPGSRPVYYEASACEAVGYQTIK